LWNLSKKYLKNPYNWVGLYKTNGEKIKDPDKIYPGMQIFIPVIIEKN
jgi:nucleoid-associated protein YgaU